MLRKLVARSDVALGNDGTSVTRSVMEETRLHAKHFNSECLRRESGPEIT